VLPAPLGVRKNQCICMCLVLPAPGVKEAPIRVEGYGNDIDSSRAKGVREIFRCVVRSRASSYYDLVTGWKGGL
jgi:hypothetical protein